MKSAAPISKADTSNPASLWLVMKMTGTSAKQDSACNVFRTAAGQSESLSFTSSTAGAIPRRRPRDTAVSTHDSGMVT